MRGLAAGLAAALALLALSPALAAAQTNASLPDIEDEVMCTICGTTLQLSNSPQAEREKAFINRLIAQGLTKEEIKQELVAEYGEDVLAVPEAKGFNLAAFIVPIGGVLIALVAIGLAARRWRKAQVIDDAGRTSSTPVTSSAENDRLDSDLGRYHL